MGEQGSLLGKGYDEAGSEGWMQSGHWKQEVEETICVSESAGPS